MKFIISKFFKEQIKSLEKKYRLIWEDFLLFQRRFQPEIGIHLGNNIYKVRRKNSSIPTGKRGGFRIIIKVHWKVALPILVYAKSMVENISAIEIEKAVESVLEEL